MFHVTKSFSSEQSLHPPLSDVFLNREAEQRIRLEDKDGVEELDSRELRNEFWELSKETFQYLTTAG